MNPSAIPSLRYRWLLFDADGTLFDYDRAERVAIEQALARLGVTFDPSCLATYRQINQALWQRVEKGELTPPKRLAPPSPPRRFSTLLLRGSDIRPNAKC